MKAFAKVLILAALGVTCLTLNTGAQQPPVIENDRRQPAPPLVPPVFAQPAYPVPLIYPNYRQVLTQPEYGTTLFNHVDGEALNLTKQLSDAKTDGDKEKIKEKLKELLLKQFDEKQKRHEKELEALEAQVKKLKEMVGKRQDNKKDIVEERMKQLQRDALGLGW